MRSREDFYELFRNWKEAAVPAEYQTIRDYAALKGQFLIDKDGNRVPAESAIDQKKLNEERRRFVLAKVEEYQRTSTSVKKFFAGLDSDELSYTAARESFAELQAQYDESTALLAAQRAGTLNLNELS